MLLAQTKSALITTSYVLLECANAAARRPYRLEVNRLRVEMERGGHAVHPTLEEWRHAWESFARGDADRAGVVDQVSFLAMRKLGIRQAFTNDRHFKAAGFEILF